MKEDTMRRIHLNYEGVPCVNITNLKERTRIEVPIAHLELLAEKGFLYREIAELFNSSDSAISTIFLFIRDYRANNPLEEPAPAKRSSAKVFPLEIPTPRPELKFPNKSDVEFKNCITFLEDGRFNGLETAKNFQKIMCEMGFGDYFYWKFHYAAFQKLAECSPGEIVELMRMAERDKNKAISRQIKVAV